MYFVFYINISVLYERVSYRVRRFGVKVVVDRHFWLTHNHCTSSTQPLSQPSHARLLLLHYPSGTESTPRPQRTEYLI